MEALRQTMLSGKSHPGCSRCDYKSSLGINSARDNSNQLFHNHNTATALLRSIELNLGNLCNMKCRMCNSGNSSRWIEDEIVLKGKSHRKLMRRSIDDFTMDMSHVEFLRFVGGEPLLEQKTIIAVLNKIQRDRGSLKDLDLAITTNASVAIEDALLSLISDCRAFLLDASTDGIGAVNDYQRTGAHWPDIEKNLRTWHDLKDTWPMPYICVASCWTLLNVHHFPEFIRWVISNIPKYSIIGQIVIDRPQLAPRNLPYTVKQDLISQISNMTGYNTTGLEQKQEITELTKLILNELHTPADLDLESVKDIIAQLDTLRNESFADIEPNIHNAIFSN